MQLIPHSISHLATSDRHKKDDSLPNILAEGKEDTRATATVGDSVGGEADSSGEGVSSAGDACSSSN
jgi:hypothetical protein